MSYAKTKHCILFALFCFLFFLCACSDPKPNTSPNFHTLPTNVEINANAEAPKHQQIPNGKHEQETCKPTIITGQLAQNDCEEDLICVPDIYHPQKGICRLACDKEQCPTSRTCQKIATLNFISLGSYCLPVQTSRDGLCQAPLDNNACSEERVCLPSSIAAKNNKPVASQFLCRNSCPFGEQNANDSCSNKEFCLLAADKTSGICGKEIKWASIKDFSKNGFSGQTCNEEHGHLFCNTSLLIGLKQPANTLCATTPNSKGKGICFAICSTPALDKDNDGQISQNEAGNTLSCPVGFECSLKLGRKLGISSYISDKTSPINKKLCDLNVCRLGIPCPAQCGPGDAECIEVSSQTGEKMGVCGAPLGNCEPL